MKKYLIESIQKTNKIVKENVDKKILIISLGNARTELPSQRENIIEVDLMMEDNDKIGVLFEYKILLIKHLLNNSDEFDIVIVRCDMGASRSQAIGTLFKIKFGIDFENNILIGNHTILTEADNILKLDKIKNDPMLSKIFIKGKHE